MSQPSLARRPANSLLGLPEEVRLLIADGLEIRDR